MEHRHIFRSRYGWTPEHVHHENGNKLDNRIDNLSGMTAKEHLRLHWEELTSEQKQIRIDQTNKNFAEHRGKHALSGDAHGNYLDLCPIWIWSVLWENAGKPTAFRDIYGIDYGTVQKYMRIYNIDYREVSKHFNRRGERLTEEAVRAAVKTEETVNQRDALKQIGLGFARWKGIQEHYGIFVNNHRITGIEILNVSSEVYDLSIQDTENFIAGGICVHNCAAPNAQNQTTDEKMGKVTATPGTTPEAIEAATHLTPKVRAALQTELKEKGKVMIPGPWSLRKGYKPKDGYGFITIDYAACELRILAEMTGDPGLIANMNQEEVDPHTFNAAIMYNCSHSEVTKGQRSAAKNGIYGKVYGIGKQKLAATLKTTPENAGKVLATFSAALPIMEKKLKARAEMALQYGYSTSMAGRKRYYIQPRNSFERAMIGRQGVNMPIQATNADITKLAMVLVDEAITPFGAVIVLSIHDELVVECPLECIEEVTEIVKEKMLEAEANFLSVVKCKVDGGWSQYWGH
jgi:hypothetical protein